MNSARNGVTVFVAVVVIVVFAAIFLLVPGRQPIHHVNECANGATPVTWLAVDGDGQTTTNMRCTP